MPSLQVSWTNDQQLNQLVVSLIRTVYTKWKKNEIDDPRITEMINELNICVGVDWRRGEKKKLFLKLSPEIGVSSCLKSPDLGHTVKFLLIMKK